MCNNARSSSAFLQTARERPKCKDAWMVDPVIQATRRYVEQVLRATDWTLSELARNAHISHTTLTRFMNREDITWTLSSRTLAKIRAAAEAKIPQPQLEAMWLIAQRMAGP